MLTELRTTTNAITGKEWVSGGLKDERPQYDADQKPLQALDCAGVGFLTPMISFLEEPLNQLRGNPEGVTQGASEFSKAGESTANLAEDYREKTKTETSGWAGAAAQDYAATAQELADGVLSVAETAMTSAEAMIKAGEVVAQAVAAVSTIIGEALGQIVPIMTQAVATAAATFGQSIAVAIPQCVQIAVDAGVRIAGKLAELLASGENLIKLVEGALAVLEVVKKALSVIGDKAQQQEVAA
ncbi:hypothetical protein BBK82_32310 [Lentzea guizhouensis]|uniref:ESX-1 secretion-associated protein EspA/EspE-like domain-containing protein n=1 Tax=Lentzea guizhouensis TaxID=1586287 RepID=A0A1B2HZL8_9PSEU|nr:hypothetical protein BBK82_32310 [Lentzea guizhouensis]